MCGICGFIDLPIAPDEARRRLAAMLAAMRHRGTEEGAWFAPGVALGCRRLPLVDVAEGRQPLFDERGTICAVVNGEIYNSPDLRRELSARGHRLRSTSDAEVLVHLYEERGEECFDALEGMYGAALYDTAKKMLLLARDPVGIKPLFIAEAEDALWFSSTIPALRAAAELPRDLDEEALLAALHLQYVPRPKTIYRAIRALRPGERIVRQGGITRRLPPRPWRPTERTDAATVVETIRADLVRSVQRSFIGERPKGVLLSGGVDSAAIAALAAREQPGLPSFTAVFDEGSFDERDAARRTANIIGTDHHEVPIDADDALDALPSLVAHFGEPFAEGSALPLFCVCRAASAFVPSLLSGEGSDELFGGYETYRAHLLAQRLASLPRSFTALCERGARHLPVSHRKVSFEFRLKRFLAGASLPPWEARLFWKGTSAPETIAACLDLAPERIARARTALDAQTRALYEAPHSADELARLAHIDFSLSLPDDLLLRADTAGMAHTVEIRVPVLSPALVRIGLGLPARWRATAFRDKILWRRAMESFLPRAITRRPKRGLNIPYAAWLATPRWQAHFRERLHTKSLEISSLFRENAVDALLREHASRRHDHGHLLWTIFTLLIWSEGTR